MNLAIYVIIAAAVVSVVCASHVTPVKQCPGQTIEDLGERIHVVPPCGKKVCKLHKGQNTTVTFRISPKHEVKTLTNMLHATIAGIPLPFIGVTGTSACAHLSRADTGEPVTCPLAPGHDYLYTNVFPIEQVYPSVSLAVHWALNDGKRDILCLEMPGVIV